MSRALARLRALLGDPILVKAPGGLAPSARAEALLPLLAASLDRLDDVLRPQAFAAEALDRTFRIAATDVHALLLGPPLLAAMRNQAPRANLSLLSVGLDVRERIQNGDIDLAFALANTPLPPGAHSEPLARDPLALVARRGAFPEKKTWALDEYAAANHATVTIFGDRMSEIDTELAETGLVRRIVFTSPHFLATLAAVASSDCVTVLSATLARRFADSLGLALYEPPLRQKALMVTTVVTATRASDPGLVWLRERLREAARKAYRD